MPILPQWPNHPRLPPLCGPCHPSLRKAPTRPLATTASPFLPCMRCGLVFLNLFPPPLLTPPRPYISCFCLSPTTAHRLLFLRLFQSLFLIMASPECKDKSRSKIHGKGARTPPRWLSRPPLPPLSFLFPPSTPFTPAKTRNGR